MTKAIKISFILFLASNSFALAQDQHFSQFYASPQYVNPALTSTINGDMRVSMHHRSQWRSIAQKNAFTSNYISFEQLRNKWGYGAYILNNQAGAAGLNELNVLFTGSYIVSVGASSKHNISMGLQLGFIQKTLNSDVTWNAQYDIDEGEFNLNTDNGETLYQFNYFLPDYNFGAYYEFKDLNKKSRPFFGLSGYHLSSPDQTFYASEESNLPTRWVFYGGNVYTINNEWKIKSHILFMKQGLAQEINVGSLAHYHFDGTEYTVMAGPYYRVNDAVSFHMGVRWKKAYTLRVSYDLTTSNLSVANGGKGAYELSFIFTRDKAHYKPSLIQEELPIY